MSIPTLWIAGAHAGASCAMLGLIWFVQVVHYPLMSRVSAVSFADYEQAHAARTTWIVAPLMFMELLTAGALVFLPRMELLPLRPWTIAGAVLLVIVWASTFFVQVPLHNRLASGFDARTHAALVHTNWLRTLVWTLRGAVAIVILIQLADVSKPEL